MKAWLLIILLAAPASMWAQAKVSRTPPAVYEKHLKAMLTPWGDIQAGAKDSEKGRDDRLVQTLIHEQIIWVDEGTGLATSLLHSVHQALTREGAKLISESNDTFAANSQRLHVLVARSSQDGLAFKEVAAEGMILKRPESSNDDTVMHTDEETVTLLFPDVTVGSMVESVTINEETDSQSKGHFMRSLTWGGLGKVNLRRLVVNLPASMEKVLQWKAIGTVLAEPKRSELPGGRVTLEWRSQGLAPLLLEDRGPPVSQMGPVLRMSTMPDWETLGRWFANSVKEQGDVTPEQVEAASRLVSGLKSDHEKAARLFEHVSQDIRYTALEFGRGRYQPRSPSMVEETRYGDCKDKANVLRVLLKHCNIESRLALLDARHVGVIDHSVPSPGRFNHAILAVTLPGDGGKKEVVFCDPTLDGAPFGSLPASDTDREALVISESGDIEWLRIPKQSFVTHEADVDLVPEPGGGVAGWIKFRMDDTYGHLTRERWTRQKAEGQKDIAKELLAKLPGHDLIDLQEISPSKTNPEPFQLSTYVLRSGAGGMEKEGTERVAFPILGVLLPPAGPAAVRHTDIVCTLMAMKVTGGYQIPQGWRVMDVPAAFEKDVAGCVMKASWREEKNRLLCHCEVRTTQSVISANQHQVLWQARRDFSEWLATPALLKRPGVQTAKKPEDEEAPPVRSANPARLPKMPTVPGQVLLIEKRFPLNLQNPMDSDHEARRIACQQMLKQFPKDRVARFEAEMRLILCDLMEGDDLSGLSKRIEPLLEDTGDALKPEQVAQGRIMLAGALVDAGKSAEGRALALTVYQDERLPLLMRQLAAGMIAMTDVKDNPVSALKMAKESLVAKIMPEMTRLPIFQVLVESLSRHPEMTPDLIQQELKALLQARPEEEADSMSELILEAPNDLIRANHLSAAEKLVDAVKLIAKADAWNEEKLDDLEYAADSVADARAFKPIHEQLRAWLDKNPWPDADKIEENDVIENSSSSEEAAGDYYDQPDVRLRYQLRALTHYGPQAGSGTIIQDLAETANDWLAEPGEIKPPAQTEALIDELLRLWASFSHDEGAEWACEAFRGHVIQRRSGPAKALAHYQAMLARPKLEDWQRIDCHERIGDQYKALKDYEALLAELEKFRQWPDNRLALGCVLDGAHLALALGDRKAAWRCLDWLAAREKADLGVFRLPKEAHAAIRQMSADHAGTELWWDRSAKWWSDWEALSATGNLTPPEGAKPTDWPWLDTHDMAEDADRHVKNKEMEMMARMTHGVLIAARHYPFAAPEVAKFLKKQAAQAFPKHRSYFLKLAAQLQP